MNMTGVRGSYPVIYCGWKYSRSQNYLLYRHDACR